LPDELLRERQMSGQLLPLPVWDCRAGVLTEEFMTDHPATYDDYHSFAEFFDREFLRGERTFPTAPHEMGAFAEARYFGWAMVEKDERFPVKGHSLNA
jgi:hypothetical protein